MKQNPISKISLLLMAAVWLLAGCEHKELCFDHAHMVDLDIRFDWSEAPEAKPRTMVVQFFRMDGSFYAVNFLWRRAARCVWRRVHINCCFITARRNL